MIPSSRNLRRASGCPRIISNASALNTTECNWPRYRAEVSFFPFTNSTLVFPSTLTCSVRAISGDSRTDPRTSADLSSNRTVSWSLAVRNDLVEASKSTASSQLVLPCPFSPTKMFNLFDGLNEPAKLRKLRASIDSSSTKKV